MAPRSAQSAGDCAFIGINCGPLQNLTRFRPMLTCNNFSEGVCWRRFGVDQAANPCDSASCRICSICSGSFDINRAGSGRLTSTAAGGVLRYGRGVYFSSVSSKSDDYAGSSVASAAVSEPGTPRCMFMCKVAAGRTFRAPSDSMEEAAALAAMAQHRCHSILCEPASGGEGAVVMNGGGLFRNLNYDELVVYNEAAAIPSYLIVYLPACP